MRRTATRSGPSPRPSGGWSPTCERPPTPPGASRAATSPSNTPRARERDVFGTAFTSDGRTAARARRPAIQAAARLGVASQQMAETSEEAGRAVERDRARGRRVGGGARGPGAHSRATRDLAAEVAGASRAGRRAGTVTRPAPRRPGDGRKGAGTVSRGDAGDARAGARRRRGDDRGVIRALGAKNSRLAASSTRSPGSRSRRICSRSTRRSRPRAWANRDADLRSSPTRCASSPGVQPRHGRRRRPGRRGPGARRAAPSTPVAAGNEVGEQGAVAVEAARASFERIDVAVDEMAERVAQIAAAIDGVADGSDPRRQRHRDRRRGGRALVRRRPTRSRPPRSRRPPPRSRSPRRPASWPAPPTSSRRSSGSSACPGGPNVGLPPSRGGRTDVRRPAGLTATWRPARCARADVDGQRRVAVLPRRDHLALQQGADGLLLVGRGTRTAARRGSSAPCAA